MLMICIPNAVPHLPPVSPPRQLGPVLLSQHLQATPRRQDTHRERISSVRDQQTSLSDSSITHDDTWKEEKIGMGGGEGEEEEE